MPPFQPQCVFVIDLRLSERRRQLDEVEHASCKLIKDGSHVVCNKPEPAPSTCIGSHLTAFLVDPVTSVRDLGIYIDADLSMRTHVLRTVSWCFAVLRQLRQIRRLIPPATFQTPMVALVLSQLDYGNGVLVGLPAYLVRRLQSVLNESARMIFQLRRSDHITDALASLHWLRVPERIQYKIAVLAYKVQGLHHVTWVRSSVCPIYQVGIASALPALIIWWCHNLNCPLLAVDHSRLLLL
jgi:hypothetical protein